MGNRSRFPVPICPSQCTLLLSPANFELRITIYWISLETIVNSIKILFETSHPRVVGQEMLFLCLSYAVPSTTRSPLSWWRSSGLRKHPVATDENFGWIHFLSRDVHKCNRQFLDSNKEGILSIALWDLFRIARTSLHCPFHESSLLIRHWVGCRRYFVANRLEVLVDEDDSRFSSQALELGSFLLVSQLHVTILTHWSQCLFPRAVWTNRWIVHFHRVSPLLHNLRLRFRLRLWLDLSVSQTLAHNWKTSLPVLSLVLSQPSNKRFRFPEHSNRIVALTKQVSLFQQLDVWSLVRFVGSLFHLQQLLNLILLSKCL